MDYSDRLSYGQWLLLIEELKKLPNFQLKVRSSPGDDYRFVYALLSDIENSEWGYQDKISFTITDKKVHIELMTHKNEFFNKFFRILIEEPLNRMPLYINELNGSLKAIAIWRLKNSI